MSRRKWAFIGCAVLVVLMAGILLVGTPAAIALRLAGFRSEGRTGDFLNQRASTVPPTIQWSGQPAPPPTPTAPADGSAPAAAAPAGSGGPSDSGSLDRIVVDIWFLSRPTAFSASDTYARRLERARIGDGTLAYYLEFDQAGINTYLNTWFGRYVAQEKRVRAVSLDLKPGGAIVYAEVDLEVGWQRVGAVFMLDASGRQLILAGVDMDGRLYSTPPDGQIASLVARLESESNRALRELTFVDPAGRLTIQSISLDEDRVQILAY
jgi:hypothetical protein